MLTGFSTVDCIQIFDAMIIPESFVLNRDPLNNQNKRHEFKISGVHAFLYTLYRFHNPAQRQSLDSEFWGYDYSVLNKMFSTVIKFI